MIVTIVRLKHEDILEWIDVREFEVDKAVRFQASELRDPPPEIDSFDLVLLLIFNVV